MPSLQPIALSLEVALLAVALAGVVGVAAAAWLTAARFKGKELVDALFTAPMVLPPTVLGYYLLVVLGGSGPIASVWTALTGGPLVFSFSGAVVAAAVGAFPFVVKGARASLADVDGRLVAAARTLGASPARTFFTVQLPLARRGLAAGLALAFARALGDFGVTLMVAGNLPGRTRTGALAIYDALQAGRDGDAALLAAVMTVLGVVVVVAVNFAGAKK